MSDLRDWPADAWKEKYLWFKDLSQRQQSEIARLSRECEQASDVILRQTDKIERLRAIESHLTTECNRLQQDLAYNAGLVMARDGEIERLQARIHDLETRLAAIASGPRVSYGGWQEAPE